MECGRRTTRQVGLIFLTLIICSTSIAIAEERVYVKGAVGFFSAEDATLSSNNNLANAVLRAIDAKISTKTDFTFNVGVGYKILDQLRAEFEFARFATSLNQGKSNVGSVSVEGDARVHAFLWNAYYDFRFKDVPVEPYIGFGIGLADQRAELNKVGGLNSGLTPGSDTTFAYNVKGGLSYRFTDRLFADLGYRYFATETPNYGFLKATTHLHSFEFGIRWLAF